MSTTAQTAGIDGLENKERGGEEICRLFLLGIDIKCVTVYNKCVTN